MLREGCQLIVATQRNVFRTFGHLLLYSFLTVDVRNQECINAKRTDAVSFYKFAKGLLVNDKKNETLLREYTYLYLYYVEEKNV